MAQKTQHVVENYSNERDRPEWRRRCKSCGRWTIVRYKAANPVCETCQKLPAGKKADLVPYTYWLVVECPGEFGYSKGAAFSAAEMREMVGRPSLIPGMVLERDGKRYIVNSRYDLRREMSNNDTSVVHCGQCGVLIGAVVNRNGRTGLLVSLCEGTVVLYRFHGFCECGGQIHWDAGDVRMARIIRHEYGLMGDADSGK